MNIKAKVIKALREVEDRRLRAKFNKLAEGISGFNLVGTRSGRFSFDSMLSGTRPKFVMRAKRHIWEGILGR